MVRRHLNRNQTSRRLRLTWLEDRITPALTVVGPYSAAQLAELAATGGDTWGALRIGPIDQ